MVGLQGTWLVTTALQVGVKEPHSLGSFTGTGSNTEVQDLYSD
uniref:Uncharacterized protein n=1 Tax=Anguilla anguilla TaxID=7936 RepID=A0A0E9S9I2_ANGAN